MAGFTLPDGLVVYGQPRDYTGSEPLQNHVRRVCQPVEDPPAFVCLEIQDHAALVPAEGVIRRGPSLLIA